LKPFQECKSDGGYVGIGKTIDAYVPVCGVFRRPTRTGTQAIPVRRCWPASKEDGYLGMFRPESRIASLWDVHEMAYIVLGLTSDFQIFRRTALARCSTSIGLIILSEKCPGPMPRKSAG